VELYGYYDSAGSSVASFKNNADSFQLIINGKPISDLISYNSAIRTYTFNPNEAILSYGYRFYFKSKTYGYSAFRPDYAEFSVNDSGIWMWSDSSYDGGNIVVSIDSNFSELNTTIDNQTVQITNKIDQSTTTITSAMDTNTNKIVSAVTSTPAQNQAATQYKDDMSQTTTQIQDNVQAIEDKTNRPDPEKTAQDIDPLGRLDPSDPARVSMYDGLGAILKTDFFLTILLMVFGMAFCGYVLFGKRG